MKKKLWIAALAAVLLLGGLLVAACAENADPAADIYAYNLAFDDQVYLEYAVRVTGVPGAGLDEVGVLIWREGASERTPETAAANLTAFRKDSVDGTACYVVKYTGLSAKEMTDKVYSQPYVKDGENTIYGEITEYSICTYAERKLGLTQGVAGTTDEKLVAMLREMLDYGASAQLYFGYKTENLANAILCRVRVNYEDELGAENPNPGVLSVASGKVKLQPLSKKGYTFWGWRNEEGEPVSEIDTAAAKTMTLYAMWQADRYSVTYRNTMGVFNPNEETRSTYTVEECLQPEALKKYDYTFNGWRIGSAYGDFLGEDGLPDDIAGNIELYADWTQKEEFRGLVYVVDDNLFLPNGKIYCALVDVENPMDVTRLEISDVFSHIQAGALKYCTRLEELTLPFLGSDYISTAGSYLGYVFGAETALGQNDSIPQSLKKVTVNGSGRIGINAFRDCTSLVEIAVSSTTRDIGQNAYLGCTSLVSLTTPVYINDAMRYEDTKYPRYLTDFYYGIPGSFDRVNHGKDYTEASLEIPRYSFETLHINGGVISSHAFQNNLGIKHLIIEGVEVIGDSAFYEAKNLETLTLHEGLTQIQDQAFYKCDNKNFNEVIIPNSVTKLGGNDGGVNSVNYNGASYDGPAETPGYRAGAFGRCCYLSKIVIGDGVEVIPYGCFDRSSTQSLDYEDLDLTLGKNVRVIAPLAFYLPAGLGYSRIINHSQHKEMLIYSQGAARRDDTKILLRALAECENRPEKIYLGYDYDNSQNLNALSGCNVTEEELLALGFTFALYTPANPYENGTAKDGFTYWNIGDPWFWISKQYDTPVLWQKPEE